MSNNKILVSLPPELYAWILALSLATGMTPGDVIRSAIDYARTEGGTR